MPRSPRLIVDNACYHAITRGNEKKVTFNEDEDFEVYLRLVARYKSRYATRLYGWCLMPNHVHMVLETDYLSKFMHGISLSYAIYFRNKYKGAGHFWQDRYKSPVILKDQYMINCVSYIEYNPVRAEIVTRPEDYRWSSYRARVLGENNSLLNKLKL